MTPYAPAPVVAEEGVGTPTSIVDGDSRAVHIGMPVEVAFGWLPLKSAFLLQGRPVNRQSNRTIEIYRNHSLGRKCWLADLMHSG